MAYRKNCLCRGTYIAAVAFNLRPLLPVAAHGSIKVASQNGQVAPKSGSATPASPWSADPFFITQTQRFRRWLWLRAGAFRTKFFGLSQKGPEHPTVVGGKYVPSRSIASSVVGRTSSSGARRLLGLFFFAGRLRLILAFFAFRFLTM
jgi:hypothetical protein